jgi:creatinine amidohydrolase
MSEMMLNYQNTCFEVRDADPDIALLPIGSTERVGGHLPVGTSTFILDVLASRIAEDLNGDVYLLPTLPIGCSDLHLGQHGTVALEWTTMVKVVSDLVESLLAQGIRKVAVLVGLGGANETTVRPRENYIVKTAVRQLNYDHRDLDAIWVQPFTVAGRDLERVLESSEQDVHAGELATSLMMYLHPESVRREGVDYVPDVGKEYLDFVAFEKLCPGGVWGLPSLATAEKGRMAFEAAVECTVKYIEESFSHLERIKKRIEN